MKSISSILYFNSAERRSWVLLILFIVLLITIHYYIKRQTMPESIDFSNYGELYTQYHESVDQVNIDMADYNPLIDEKVSTLDKEKKGYTMTLPQIEDSEHFKVVHEDNLQASDVSYLINDTIQENNKHFTTLEEDKNPLNVHVPENSEDLSNNTNPSSSILIDINFADEIQLQYVKGIGPAFAERIIKYRKLIGGFHNIYQLMEVYGIDREKFMQMKGQIKLTGETEKVNINSLDQNQISRHPYISYQEAKLIVAYRKKHGPYKSVYEIIKIGVMDSSFVKKILPYIPDSLNSHNAQAPLTSL